MPSLRAEEDAIAATRRRLESPAGVAADDLRLAILDDLDDETRRVCRALEPLTTAARWARATPAAARAVEVLGRSRALRWLRKANRELPGGQSPLERLAEEGGPEEVLELLDRIDHGVFS